MYNITLNDELIGQTRQLFSNESAMTEWLQRQVEALLREFNAKQTVRSNARKTIEAMRRQSEQNGNAELTLNEINNEIHLARKARNVAVVVTGNLRHFPKSPIVVTPAEMIRIIKGIR